MITGSRTRLKNFPWGIALTITGASMILALIIVATTVRLFL